MIVVMAKVPKAGAVKTRLVPLLGADGAAALCRAMTEDVLDGVRASGLPFRIALSGNLADPWVRSLDAPVERQCAGDLGARLRHALRDGGIAIGTDAPTLPATFLTDAAASLGGHDAVWAPALDGGYVLVGVRPTALGVFDEIPWSTAETLAASVARADALGLRHARLPFWYDVDDPSGLRFVRNHLSTLPPDCAPRTRAFLQDLPDAPPHR
ncbi:MAG: TIGR04282 family arsenosugar biosynthesis glycosyltransferase [Myxococcota bacterium]